jgi:hypothetical protein
MVDTAIIARRAARGKRFFEKDPKFLPCFSVLPKSY